MINASQVDDGVWRGPQPVTIEDMAYLKKIGIKFSLDLETGSRFLSDGDPLSEALLIERYSIRAYSHPLGEILPPTAKELSDAVSFIKTHQPIYVHCKAGVDRTGMVIAAYRMAVQGWTKPVAVSEIERMGLHWWYYWWPWFL